MKFSALLPTLLLQFIPQTSGTSRLGPVINGGQASCNALRSREAGADLKNDGLLCLRVYADDPEHMDVDVYIAKAGWELDGVFVWIGSDPDDAPSSEWSESDDYGFPLVKRSVGKKEIILKPSLWGDLEFSCSQESAKRYAMVKVTIRSQSEDDTQMLRVVHGADETIDPLIPFTLSCKEFTVQQIENPQALLTTTHSKGRETSFHRYLRK